MKEIYVYRPMFGDWKGLSKEEANKKIEGGRVYGAKIKVNYGNDTIKIMLLADRFMVFEDSIEGINNLIKEYIEYVEEITGIVLELAPV